MLLEEFLVVLGANTETDKVTNFGAALTKVASIATIVVGALKTVSLAAWAFADGYVRRAEELYKSNNELVKITKEQVEMSNKYVDGMGRLGKIIDSVKVRIAFGFLPTMLNMVNTFNEFLDANKDLIVNGISKLLNVVTLASQVINNTVRFIVKAIDATIGWKGALYVLAAAFVFVKRAMLLAFITNPITWVIAAIVGLMLLIDDFMAYLDGGESQFGEFWGSMVDWIKANEVELKGLLAAAIAVFDALKDVFFGTIEAIKTAFVGLGELIGAVAAFIVGLFTGDADLILASWSGMIKSIIKIFQGFGIFILSIIDLILKAFGSSIGNIVGYFSNMISSITSAIKNFVSSIPNMLANVVSYMIAPFAQAFSWIADKFSSIGGLVSGAIGGAKSAFSLGGASSASNSSIVNGGNMTVNAPISITSTDPKRAGAMVESGLYNATNNTYRNMNSKVIA